MFRTKLAAAGASAAAAALVAGLAGPADAATGYIEIISGSQDQRIVDPNGCLDIATTGPAVRLTVVNHTDQTIGLYDMRGCLTTGVMVRVAPGSKAAGSFQSLYAPITAGHAAMPAGHIWAD